jgi:hypothetical protein
MSGETGWTCIHCGNLNVNTTTCITCGRPYSLPPSIIKNVSSELSTCVYCGASIPKNSNYCSNCGKVLKIGLLANEKTPVWEICNIFQETRTKVRYKVMMTDHRYIAKVIGPKGTYIAGTTKWISFIYLEEKKAHEGLDILLNQLINIGFQPVGLYGSHYFEYQLNRQVK